MSSNNIMVDIETTGIDSSHCAMIQLAAVRFDLDARTVDMSMFDRCLAIPPGRFWDEGTREWWGKQKPEVIQGIYARMEDPVRVMHDFARWCGEGAILWAKPTHFEFPFLQSYAAMTGAQLPFAYWAANDLNSWCRAHGHDRLDKDLEFEGDEHNALHDVLHQIKTVFELRNRIDG